MRFQGGTLFPAVVVGVVLLGLLTIVYARQSRPDPGSFPPQQGDHWHAAYGMYVCDGWLPKLTGAKEETITDSTGNRTLVNDNFASTGIHSHDDGVIHYHPNSSKAVGKRARLGLLLDVYGVDLSTDRLALPDDQGGEVYDVDDFKCNGEDVEIKVVAWNSFEDTGKGTTNITDLADVKITNDGMVFAIAVVPVGTAVTMPPWAAELPALGAADLPGGAAATTTVPVTDSTVTDSTDSTDSTVTATTGG